MRLSLEFIAYQRGNNDIISKKTAYRSRKNVLSPQKAENLNHVPEMVRRCARLFRELSLHVPGIFLGFPGILPGRSPGIFRESFREITGVPYETPYGGGLRVYHLPV
jgi:hypothetical protein